MDPIMVIGVIAAYFLLLFLISWRTGQSDDDATFFQGGKASPWYLVAFGMIGASLSGVTFVSVPGWVESSQFTYMQMVFGYLIGYMVIATVLMPLYYKLELTSIYEYFQQRFGIMSYKTGSLFFLLSRTIGASFRIYLVVMVLQDFIFSQYGVPFYITVFISIFLIWVYTFRGGIKTVVWTDTLQTAFMLLSVIVSLVILSQTFDLSFLGMIDFVKESSYSTIWVSDFSLWKEKNFFIKHIISGAFMAIVMTGMDQDMMQKNLTCKNVGEAKKNMFWFSIVLVFVNLLFLTLGALLYTYAKQNNIVIEKADMLYPTVVKSLGVFATLSFLLGLIAAAYSSADSALTALTTSFCIDFLGFKEGKGTKKTRYIVHLGFSLLLGVVVIVFKSINNDSVISDLFKIAGYTYGPILGLFTFGLLTKFKIVDKWAPIVCLLSPVLSYVLQLYSKEIFNGYQFGFELLLVNGLFTFLGLLILSVKQKNV